MTYGEVIFFPATNRYGAQRQYGEVIAGFIRSHYGPEDNGVLELKLRGKTVPPKIDQEDEIVPDWRWELEMERSTN
jgi:hypothetical protein